MFYVDWLAHFIGAVLVNALTVGSMCSKGSRA
jgi:hypothetical protein